jgi:uncharacterized protein YndB with AHSA1/START domain
MTRYPHASNDPDPLSTRAKGTPMTHSTLRHTTPEHDNPKLTRLERHFPTTPEHVWRLWTTPKGIGSWWAPDGFRTDVSLLDLRPGGELVYAVTAVGADQIAFVREFGLPLTTVSRKTFTEVAPPGRLAYVSFIDFVPDHEPYEHLTVVDLAACDGGTAVVMTMEPMHDERWTQRLVGGRNNELDNLARLLGD